ncbi:hypothetical protein [Luteibaculum oceani]|uniref:N-acetylglucosamine kinase n=1 Tax=Luteibaculum oceani TaxID=1294296 RepID=A0A5C6UWD1_9FLAO|nr:hypothetical protein [Luteibaculum oceani]TXC76964.1 hypothetical protein FRX97_10140 [Luteibaculum oceani]
MKILVADSGGTKADWAYLEGDGNTVEWTGKGLNPNTKSTNAIIEELNGDPFKDIEPQHIYFYGAGCSTGSNQQLIQTLLKERFPSATKIEVRSDLYAAAYATVGNGDGVVGILGTGANSALFKNGAFVRSRPSYGYLMGDEGSGAYLGKMFLKAWLEKEFSPTLLETLEAHKPSEEEIVTRLYAGEESVTKVFGSFVPLLSKYQSEFPELGELVKQSFRDYVKYFIHCYPQSPKQCFFVGSIAFYFQDQLKQVLEEAGLELKKVIQRPMPGLIDWVLGVKS